MSKVITMTKSPDQWARAVDFLLRTGGIRGVNPETDTIHLAVDAHGDVRGLFAARLTALVHEFRLDDSLGLSRRSVADSLWNYAMGSARASGLTDGIVLVDNANVGMLRFLEGRAKAYGDPENDKVFLVKVE